MDELQKAEVTKIVGKAIKRHLLRVIIGDKIMNFFGGIICGLASLIPTPEFSNVTFWKSRNKKYLYYCMSEVHITEEKTFLKAFPEAERISQTEFDLLIYFYPDRIVVEVGDAGIVGDEDDITIDTDKIEAHD